MLDKTKWAPKPPPEPVITGSLEPKPKKRGRKPKPKMITDLARKYQIDLKRSFMIGDRHSDMVAGSKAGCTPIFIKNDLIEESNINNYISFKNLLDATNFILKFNDR